MLGECHVRAATIFGTGVDAVEVKDEGQRVDTTHAVNSKVFVRGMRETFQCSFEPKVTGSSSSSSTTWHPD